MVWRHSQLVFAGSLGMLADDINQLAVGFKLRLARLLLD
jgi:hypothetical protein